ncbi:MAG: molecular chaperone TorD family protein [Deltaproteobacteria bacterium]|nr:molecular chaperone TorD family protein [Deltaproteobacteria bacterium]
MELAIAEDPSVRAAASRSRMYQLIAAAFAFPDEEFFDALRRGMFARAVADTADGLPYDAVDPSALCVGDDGTYTEFESEYIRLFDLGAAGPPCPLYGGLYGGDRMKVMEDATRFYNFFQLRLSSEMRELPDHITTQLEFLHYLTFREAEVCQHGGDTSSLLRAERDFLTRHPCKWVPKLQARLVKQNAEPFFSALVSFAADFFERDRGYAAAAAGPDVD